MRGRGCPIEIGPLPGLEVEKCGYWPWNPKTGKKVGSKAIIWKYANYGRKLAKSAKLALIRGLYSIWASYGKNSGDFTSKSDIGRKYRELYGFCQMWQYLDTVQK